MMVDLCNLTASWIEGPFVRITLSVRLKIIPPNKAGPQILLTRTTKKRCNAKANIAITRYVIQYDHKLVPPTICRGYASTLHRQRRRLTPPTTFRRNVSRLAMRNEQRSLGNAHKRQTAMVQGTFGGLWRGKKARRCVSVEISHQGLHFTAQHLDALSRQAECPR